MRRLTLVVVLCCTSAIALAQQSSTRQAVHVATGLDLPFSPAVKAGDFIYVAGTLGTDKAGKVSGDIKAQTRRALDNIGTALKAAGVTFNNVAFATVHVKNAADIASVNEIYGSKWSKDPPARTTVVVDNFVLPDALVEINMIAARNGITRTAIRPAGWAAPAEPMSYGVKAGNTVFVSGIVARNDKDNSVVAGDAKTQTKAVMDDIGTILKAADMDFTDVTAGRVWVTQTPVFQDMNSVYRTYYQKDLPARATLIGHFANPQDLVQISVVADKGSPRQPVAGAIAADGSMGNTNPNYSAGLAVAKRMYITGMTGSTPTTTTDMKAQTRETLERMVRVLKAGGFDVPDVVDVHVYISDVSKFDAMNEGYKQIFSKDYPSRTTVQAANLGGSLIEIVMTAAR